MTRHYAWLRSARPGRPGRHGPDPAHLV